MTDVTTSSPEAAYLTKTNIVHPRSGNAPLIAEAEAAARADIGNRRGGITVSSGSIRKGS